MEVRSITFIIIIIIVVVVIFGVSRLIKAVANRRKSSQSKPHETISEPFRKQPIVRELEPASQKEVEPTSSKQQSEQRELNVFISYRRKDSADVTGRIYDRLTQHFGQSSIFKDVDAIPLGVDFRVHLDQAVGKCSVLIAVIGNQWLTETDSDGKLRLNDPRDFVRIEIESALKRRIPVIPVLVQSTSMPSAEKLPVSLSELAYRNGIPIRPDPDFHKDMDRLIRGIESFV
jgi:hypothetical protein